MIWINQQLKDAFCFKKSQRGLFLIELLIVLGLLSVVLSIGYMLFSFGYNSFFIAEARSDVQQNVRMVADFISREVRHATEATLLDASQTIPAAADIADENTHYIFLNADGKVEYRTKDQSFLIPSGISDRIDFGLEYFVSASSNRILAFHVSGTRDTGQINELTSEVYLENLAFRNSSIATIGTEYHAIRLIKEPSAILVAMSVNPNMVDENPYGPANYVFDLGLLNETFTAELTTNTAASIVLGDDFAGMNVLTASIDGADPTKATIILQGILTQNAGTGSIRVNANALEGDEPLEARVLITIPVGILTAIPNPVYPAEFQHEFFLEVYNNTFIAQVLPEHIKFFEDLADLKPDLVERLSDTTLRVTVTGDLLSEDGVGSITVSGDGFSELDSEALTARLIVYDLNATPQYRLSVSKRGEGTVSPIPGIYYFSAGDSRTFTATPAANWTFLKWVIDGTTYTYDENATPNNTEVTISDMPARNVSAEAYFRLYLENVPAGSFISYQGQDYIVLSKTRLMEKSQSSNTFKWENNVNWPSYSELEGLSPAVRGGAGNYWTSTSSHGNHAYYVTYNGALETRNKNDTINRRWVRIISEAEADSVYFESGEGTATNPYR
jgi:Tfp pilus assembly protein PilE